MQSSIFCAAAAPLLGNVSIILVAPKEPGNVGSVLRAGANFDVKTVGVVAPRCDPYDSDVYRLACDSPLLDTMQVFPTLKEALTLKISSIGFTRRAGRGRQTHPSLPSLLSTCPGVSQQIFQTNSSSGGDVALVFGREESGLLDVEVGLCTHACAIPSAPTFPSLNLSHAVAVVLSSLYAARATSEEWEESGEQKKLMTMMRGLFTSCLWFSFSSVLLLNAQFFSDVFIQHTYVCMYRYEPCRR